MTAVVLGIRTESHTFHSCRTPLVQRCFVFERTGAKVNWVEGRDVRMAELLLQQRPYCPAEVHTRHTRLHACMHEE